ncbi:hypothetical protein HHK36_015238 [Tetracentron sinense]|uniref:CLAVATA3/ESR (CLE)-related protein 25 n=1 Tax=Tetracentron sinense TaxID=13715 RepID=A0A835DDG3_TETSI|nr:hypothetical protein HHK36_015238 [Tetracentron sinense]
MMRNMGSSGGFSKALFGALAFMSFIWLLSVAILASGGTKTITVTASSTGNFKPLEVLGRERPVVHRDLDINYNSKRKVPNGPDPIHNRRAGKSRRPPGRA